MRTMKEIARECIEIQNAINLSGVIHAWSRLFPDLRALVERECKERGEDFSTDKLNRHRACILFSDKIASLTGSGSASSFNDAYNWALKEVEK